MASRPGIRLLNKTAFNTVTRPTSPANYRGSGVRQLSPTLAGSNKRSKILATGRKGEVVSNGFSNSNLVKQLKRNVDTNNPMNILGSYIYTSQYSDEAIQDAKKRAKKGDIISQIYVATSEKILDPVRETYMRDTINQHPVVSFTSGMVQFLPNVISTIPAGLQAVNLLQKNQTDVVKKGYQSIPGIITDTIKAAHDTPLAFAGTVTAGLAVGGSGVVGGVGKVGKPKRDISISNIPERVSEIREITRNPKEIRDTIVTPAGLTHQQRKAAERRAKYDIVGEIVTSGSKHKRAKSTNIIPFQNLPKSVSEIANLGIEKGAKKGFRDSTVTPAGWTKQQRKAAERKAKYDIVRNVMVREGTIKVEKNTIPTFSYLKTLSTSNPNTRSYILKNKKSGNSLSQVNKPKSTTSSTRTEQKTIIKGNVPTEFKGKVAPGYSADVKIRGNTFVITPIEEGITLNSKIPSTIRPVSFDDVVQDLVKNQGIVIKTGDRRATVTKTEPSNSAGIRMRYPDYQPNLYRPISSEDYFASAIGGRGNSDIYTYPFGKMKEYTPKIIPKTINAVNLDVLFNLIDKTVNPTPTKKQNLDAFKDHPRMKDTELVEVGKTSKPRILPRMIQPLKVTKIEEYVTEFQKISFTTQKQKGMSRYSSTEYIPPTLKIKYTGKSKKTTKASGDNSVSPSLPKYKVLNGVGVVVTTSIKITTSPEYLPVDVPLIPEKVIPDDTVTISDSSDSVGIVGDKSNSQTSHITTTDSILSVISEATAFAANPRISKSSRTSKKVRTNITRSNSQKQSAKSNKSRLWRYTSDISPLKERRKHKDIDIDGNDKSNRKKKKRVSKRYGKRQIVNPIPWLYDSDKKFTQKIPKKVMLVQVSDILE